jgi:hypothetical protein
VGASVSSDLASLSEQQFQSLSEAEHKLLEAAQAGQQAICGPSHDPNDPLNDPANANSWGPERAIRVSLLEWLCVGDEASRLVHHLGISVLAARFDGKLDLSFVTLSFPLSFKACWWPDGITLRNLALPEFSLTKCWVGNVKNVEGLALDASRVRITGTVLLNDGFQAEGEVRLLQAEIGGLSCAGGRFKSSVGQPLSARGAKGPALNANGAKIGGAVLLREGFHAEGEVQLLSAEIGGNLDCDGGSFTNSEGPALNAGGAKIGGAALLRKNPRAGAQEPTFEAAGEVRFFGAEIGRNLECDGGVFKNTNGFALTIEGAKIGGAVLLRKNSKPGAPAFEAEGEVRLFGAEIAANLDCSGGFFKNPKRVALNVSGAKIGGAAFLQNGFRAEGVVNLFGAQLGGNLNCDGGKVTNSAGTALTAEGAKIGGAVLLRKSPNAGAQALAFEAEGEVRFFGAEIGGSLECDGGRFRNSAGVALSADRAKISGGVLLRNGFRAEGEVRLFRAEIAGLSCVAGTFENLKGLALSAYGARIGGAVLLRRGFQANGEVELSDTQIGGNLDCAGGAFKNPGRFALNLAGTKIGGAASLQDGFRAEGAVDLFGAQVGGNLNCDGGRFTNVRGVALNAEGARIGGAALLRKYAGAQAKVFEAEGEVRFFGAEIGRNLECSGGSFRNQGAVALNLVGATIRGSVFLKNNFRAEGEVTMRRAAISGDLDVVGMQIVDDTKMNLGDGSCAVLVDATENGDPSKSWPSDKKLVLDGFVYRRLFAPGRAADRLKWLRQQLPVQLGQRGGWFRPQPYKQLAGVLRSQGQDAEARAILMGLARDRRKWADLSRRSRAWQWVLEVTIGSGYQPFRALIILLFLWVVGFVAFGWGYQRSVMVPSDRATITDLANNTPLPGHYEPFCALVYAIDTELPIINLGQRDRWHASSDALRKTPQSGTHDWLYEHACEASFTKRWDPAGQWVGPSTLATSLTIMKWVSIAAGLVYRIKARCGVSGLIGRD